MSRLILLCLVLVCGNDAARILAYYPAASISHQVVFRPLTLELIKRGHEVVVITTDPMFAKGDSPANLKEIDVHDLSYKIWKNLLIEMGGNFNFEMMMKMTITAVEEQLKTADVQKLLSDKTPFDLVIVEAFAETGLVVAHHFNAPVIQFSSAAMTNDHLRHFGAAMHPFLYPILFHQRVYNLTALEKFDEWYKEYKFDQIVPKNKKLYDDFVKRVLGASAPSFDEIRVNTDMLFLNVHPIWDSNRPVPPNVVYIGGLHQKPQKDLPKDLQTYLDSSKNGVIYVSFGTNVDPALFFADKVQTLVNVFSKLPYDVLWKWNQDELPGRTPNIKISKWLPQSDLLRHPKVKLFVTQGGLQSTDEAITAGVPMVGIPVFGDQFFNVEQYLNFRIGERVDIKTITEEQFSTAINRILSDNSYRENVAKLRSIMNDQPQTSLERAVWWTEYVIRHKGAKHLRSPAANMSLAEYWELELVSYLLLALLLAAGVAVGLVYLVYSAMFRRRVDKKVKNN